MKLLLLVTLLIVLCTVVKASSNGQHGRNTPAKPAPKVKVVKEKPTVPNPEDDANPPAPMKEVEVDIVGTEMKGGTLDDAIDAGQPLGLHVPPSPVEIDIEIVGTEVEGGTLDDAIDAGQPLGLHTKETETPASIPVKKEVDEAHEMKPIFQSKINDNIKNHSLYCNDQKFGVSLVDAMGYVFQSDGIQSLFYGEQNLTQNSDDNEVKGTSSGFVHDVIDSTFEDENAATIKDKLTKASNFGSDIANAEIPVTALFSDGKFTINGTIKKHNIKLIQHNYAITNMICSMELSYYLGSFLRNKICSCGKYNGIASAATFDKNNNENYEWCTYDEYICENHLSEYDNNSSKVCTLVIDPFRTACISYDKSDIMEVKYDRFIPKFELNNKNSCGISFYDVGLSIDQTLELKAFHVANILQVVGQFLDVIFEYLPVYLVRMILGLYVLSAADDIASNILFQYTLCATCGIAMAIIWIVAVIYKTAESTLKQSAFLPGLGLVIVGPLWYSLSSPTIQNLLFTGVLNFWKDGWLGYPNAGKIYFVISMIISIGLKHYFKLFTSKSSSLYVLTKLIQIISCTLLFYCTSNRELSGLFLLYGLLQEYITYLWFRARLAYEVSNQKSATVMMGRPLYKQDELNKLSFDTTKYELEKLRLKYSSNPEFAEDIKTKLKFADKDEQANRLTRFINGAYHLASIPLNENDGISDEDNAIEHDLDEDGSNIPKKRSGWLSGTLGKILFFFIGLCIITGLGLTFQRSRTEDIYHQLSDVTSKSLPHIIEGFYTIGEFTKNTVNLAADPIRNAMNA